jgi:peptidoglycan/xylan/chitin deacetylase (PgdA/CDA1 family)
MRYKGTFFFIAVFVVFSVILGFNANTIVNADEVKSSAVIIVYHRFGESAFASTNIRMEQFKAHIAELQKKQYNVIPIPEIIKKLNSGEKLPERTVGLSIDDAHRSVYEKAWPLLREAKMPFTLFIATDVVDRQATGYMNWNEIRKLKAAGVSIGNQTKSHKHLPFISIEDTKVEVDKANSRILSELGSRPDLFAYPYGEYNLPVREIIVNRGFKAAFTQSSGALNANFDKFSLPRFALNERYGGIDRFRLITNALPLPVSDILPRDPLILENPPAFGFTVSDTVGSLGRLACFSSIEGEVRLERLGRRIEARFNSMLPRGRSRVNCTMPGPEKRWRWFGVQFLVAQ